MGDAVELRRSERSMYPVDQAVDQPGLDLEPETFQRDQRNRAKLLKKVQSFWIEGVLERSLHALAPIALPRQSRPEAVTHPWGAALGAALEARHEELAPDKSMAQIFEDANRALLILGEPGSGKTTALLQLAQDALAAAEQDTGSPIPVVFNLSSWTRSGQTLESWLVDELRDQYQVPARVGEAWLRGEALMLLLDGLDEVDKASQARCVQAINHFRLDYGLADMAVCCRAGDYAALGERLNLDGAIVLLPLSLEQVDHYLACAGEKTAAVRRLLDHDPALRDLARTPLNLSILLPAYQDLPESALTLPASPEERRAHLFDTYIRQMLSHREYHADGPPYAPEQTRRWLGWLAGQLSSRSQSVFLIEGLHPDWLPARQRWLFGLLVRLLVGLAVGFSVGLTDGLAQGFQVGAPLGILEGAVFGLVAGIAFWLAFGLGIGLFGSLALGGMVSAAYSYAVRWVQVHYYADGAALYSAFGIIGGLAAGLGIGLVGGLSRLSRAAKDKPATVEVLRWSWGRAGFGLLTGSILGAFAGLAIQLFLRQSFGFPIAIMVGLAVGLIRGMTADEVEQRTFPNQGIWRSARHAARMALALGVTAGLVFGVYFGRHGGAAAGAWIGTAAALSFFLIGGLLFGGLTCLRHFLLRVMLYRQGRIPWNYARFLDYAAGHVLLQRVGGGYGFTHRLLLEHLAGKDEVGE